MHRRLILASASPRRRELLQRIGVEPDSIQPANIDETPQKTERPRPYVIRMALEKALAVAGDIANTDGISFVLSGDTVVAAGRRILPKTESPDEARQCLELLSGRRHRVLSAVTVIAPDGTVRSKMSESIVQFKRLHPREIDTYIASNEWHGKAGGYAIQGTAEALIRWMSGSYSGVMGLPLYETRMLLVSSGYLTASSLALS
jgi:septum formation protein